MLVLLAASSLTQSLPCFVNQFICSVDYFHNTNIVVFLRLDLFIFLYADFRHDILRSICRGFQWTLLISINGRSTNITTITSIELSRHTRANIFTFSFLESTRTHKRHTIAAAAQCSLDFSLIARFNFDLPYLCLPASWLRSFFCVIWRGSSTSFPSLFWMCSWIEAKTFRNSLWIKGISVCAFLNFNAFFQAIGSSFKHLYSRRRRQRFSFHIPFSFLAVCSNAILSTFKALLLRFAISNLFQKWFNVNIKT